MSTESIGLSESSIDIESSDLMVSPEYIQQEQSSDIIETNEPAATAISIEKELKIILTQGGNKTHVLRVMKQLFGKKLVEKIAQFIPIKTWPQTIDNSHTLTLMGSIGQAITIQDLEQVFIELQTGNITREILKFSKIPYLRMWWAGSVQQLPHYWLNHILEMFRNPLQFIDPKYETPLGKALFEANIYKNSNLSYTYFDYAIKKLKECGNQSKSEFLLAPRELIAKYISYAEPVENGMIIPIFDQISGKLNYYLVSDQIHYKGLNTYFLTPFNSSLDLPATLIFRGTNCTLSTYRDLDPKGVGKTVFDETSSQIKAMIEGYAQKCNNAKIEIIGHSLGGADAQRALIDIINPKNTFQYASVKLFAYCSPKLDTSTIDQWNQNLNALQESEKKPAIQLNFAHHEQDILTWAGDAYISGTDQYFIPYYILVVKSDSGKTSTLSHHTAPFFLFGNFDFHTDNRIPCIYNNLIQEKIHNCFQKIKEIENTSNWYQNLKNYFFHVETLEEIQERIKNLQEEEAKLIEDNQDLSYLKNKTNTDQYLINYIIKKILPIIHPFFDWLYLQPTKDTASSLKLLSDA